MSDRAQAYEHILFDIEEGVARITFNLPGQGNALDFLGVQETVDALALAAARSDVGAVLLTGAGAAFCAGFNLREIPQIEDPEAVESHFRVLASWWHHLLHGIVHLPKPVLASVNGVAVGSGLGITLCSDMAICSESARFFCGWHAIGLANDATTSYSLSRIVGFRRAMELMLTNRTLDAREALEWGLVNRVYADSELREQERSIARQLAAAPTSLQAMAKESFHRGWRMAVEEATAMEVDNVMRSLSEESFKESVRGFLERKAKSDRPLVELPRKTLP